MKLSIVTPVYNGERYIREAIESVLSQEGDFDLEYIVVDGASTDRTLGIIREYKDKLERGEIAPRCTSISMSYVSEKDDGMYDAIAKGFAKTDGEIMAWINADDHYLPSAFQTIVKCFETFPETQWVKGRTCVQNIDGSDEQCAPCYVFERSWIQRGIYGRYAYFIHQDSVFWRRDLWNKVRSIDPTLELAGDYWLWVHFAEHAPLYSVDKKVSVFRKRQDSLSHAHMDTYRSEQKKILKPNNDRLEWKIKVFFWLKSKLKADWLSIKLYPSLFKREQKDYIEMTSGTPTMRKARSYIA